MKKLMLIIILMMSVDAFPSEAESYDQKLSRARELRLGGNPEAAMEIYAGLLEKNRNDVDALVGRGFCKLRVGDSCESALDDFIKVTVLTPAYVDAYVGASIAYKRLGRRKEAREILEAAAEQCEGNPKRGRYLAESVWREGHFVLARELDALYPPQEDRKLLPEPYLISATYGFSWLERGDDWEKYSLSCSFRSMPDTSWSAGYEKWLRYGSEDWALKGSYRHRHDDFWSWSYGGYFSDGAGFLAEQKHSPTLTVKPLRRTSVSIGPRLSNYHGKWSRRGKASVIYYHGNAYASYGYSRGLDTHNIDVESHSFRLGYSEEEKYSLSAGYTTGIETVEIRRRKGFVYRGDHVESASMRLGCYLDDNVGLYLSGLYEWRDQDLFRREAAVSLFYKF